MNRPNPLGVIPYYESKHSRHPESVRISFDDGSTAVFELKPESPHPQLVAAVTIIRAWDEEDWKGYKPPRLRGGLE